eukprot:27398-Eustigmatos_ZCMA.PRE.1
MDGRSFCKLARIKRTSMDAPFAISASNSIHNLHSRFPCSSSLDSTCNTEASGYAGPPRQFN